MSPSSPSRSCRRCADRRLAAAKVVGACSQLTARVGQFGIQWRSVLLQEKVEDGLTLFFVSSSQLTSVWPVYSFGFFWLVELWREKKEQIEVMTVTRLKRTRVSGKTKSSGRAEGGGVPPAVQHWGAAPAGGVQRLGRWLLYRGLGARSGQYGCVGRCATDAPHTWACGTLAAPRTRSHIGLV